MHLPDTLTIVPSFTTVSLVLGVALTAMLSGDPATAAEETELNDVLEKIRQAVGYGALREQIGGVLIEGDAHYQGQQGSYSFLFTPEGKYILRVHVRRDQIVGFDGATCWGADWSGTPHVFELEDLEFEQTVFGVRTGRWLANDGPFRIALSDSPGDKGQVRLRLQLKQGLEGMELDIDRATWLPMRLTARRLGTHETWEFQDYRPVLGMMVPHRTLHRMGGLVDTLALRTVRPAPPTSLAPFRPALDLPHDTHLRSSESAKFEVKQTPSGHLFVRPKVNGQDVGWFALDTGAGAGMTISPLLADRLKMPAFGTVVQGGAGKLGQGRLREGQTFELGSIIIKSSIYLELPQSFCDAMKKLFGLELVGTCGYDLFSRSVVEIDLKNRTACCYEPTTYKLASGLWERLLLNRKVPCVNAAFDGNREGLFHLDTGAGSNILFHASAVEKLKLLENRATTPIQVGGVGGTLAARIGPLGWFQVGEHRLEKLTAIFLAPHEGALNTRYVAGTFGSGILKGVKIIFDYPHRRIAFGS